MTNPQGQPALQVGDIVSVPICAVCEARESLRTPLTLQTDGSYLCAIHARADLRDIQQRGGAGALSVDNGAGPATAARARPAPPPDSPYEVLGIPTDATAEEIETARKKLQQYWLPRRAGAQRGRAEEMLDHVAVAYDDLIDPERRRAVDEKIRQRARTDQETRLSVQVAPLEDWAGRNITSLKDFVTACESSPQNWRIGEGILLNGGLLTWTLYSLRDIDTARIIESILKRSDLSDMRKLNEFLYRVNPERPFRVLARPDVVFLPVAAEASVTSVEALVKYADAHWDAIVAHVYEGELVTWLEAKASRGVYGDDFYDVRQFYDRFCATFARTPAAGAGLELLLEFLDPALPRPKLRIAFDGQENGYALRNWDGELPHRRVTMKIENTTRGYATGRVSLNAPTAKEMTVAPWVSLSTLPLERIVQSGSGSSATWDTSPQLASFQLKGAGSNEITFYLGNFNALSGWRTYTRSVTLERFERSPTQAIVVGTYPLSIRVLRFLAGYRLALWWRGLRGGLPGLLLDGGLGYALGWLLVLLGTLCAPHATWTFFAPSGDFPASGGVTAMGVFDLLLMALLRPFYCATAVFGYQLPLIFGAVYGFFGFFTGRRRGHTKYSSTQDREMIRGTSRLLALGLLIWATGMLIANLGAFQAPVLMLPVGGLRFTYRLIAFFFTSRAFSPPPSTHDVLTLFAVCAVICTTTSAFVVGRIVNVVRQRLYKWTEKSAGSLLHPLERG